MVRRFQDYEPFAWLYHRYWGEDFHARILKVLDKAGLAKLRPGSSVLDLCCGDGRLTEKLLRRRFKVTGLDGSARMLAYAAERCPAGKFLLGDAREFILPERFHAVVSTYDSLNHIMRDRDLAKVFSCVWQCLKPGGIFLFDLNGEAAYREVWQETTSIVDEQMVAVARGEYDERRRVARCGFTVIRLENGAWTRSDFQLRQKCHRREAVLRALGKTGFQAEVHAAKELGMDGHYSGGRDVYIARKPGPARRPVARLPRIPV